MKVITELIDYLWYQNKLSENEHAWLIENGFCAKPSDTIEESTEEYELPYDRVPLEPIPKVDFSEAVTSKLGDVYAETTRKGKGTRARKPMTRLTIEAVDAKIRATLSAPNHSLAVLFPLVGKGKEAAWAALTGLAPLDETSARERLRQMLFFQPDSWSSLYHAIFDTDFIDLLWDETARMAPKKRELARRILTAQASAGDRPDREGFRLGERLFRLRRILLECWHDWNPVLLAPESPYSTIYPGFLSLHPRLMATFLMMDNLAHGNTSEYTVGWYLYKEKSNALATVALFFPDQGLRLIRLMANRDESGQERTPLPGISFLPEPHMKPFAWLRPSDWIRQMQYHSQKVWFLEYGDVAIHEDDFEFTSNWYENATCFDVSILPDLFKPLIFYAEEDDNALTIRREDHYSHNLQNNAHHFGIFAEELEEVRECREGMIPAKIDGKWGFLNKRGFWALKPVYLQVLHFSEGLAAVEVEEGKWTYIYPDGRQLKCFDLDGKQLKCYFVNASSFSEGFAACQLPLNTLSDSHSWYFVNKQGRFLTLRGFREIYMNEDLSLCVLDQMRDFHEGRAAIPFYSKLHNDLIWGYINQEGKPSSCFYFEAAWDYREGRAAVKKKGLWGFLDRDGKEVIPCQYLWAWSFSEGRAAVMLAKDTWNWIDLEGRLISPVNYQMTGPFSEGWGGFYDAEKKAWSFVDPDGHPCGHYFDSTTRFSEGRCIAKRNRRVGMVDAKFGFRLLHNTLHAFPFSEGIAVEVRPVLCYRDGIRSGVDPLVLRRQREGYFLIDKGYQVIVSSNNNNGFVDAYLYRKGLNAFEAGRYEDYNNTVSPGFTTSVMMTGWAFSEGMAAIIKRGEDKKWQLLFRLKRSDLQPETDWIVKKATDGIEYSIVNRHNNTVFMIKNYWVYGFYGKNNLIIQKPGGLLAIIDFEKTIQNYLRK